MDLVAATLWTEWDPIGIRNIGGPSDEYDSYAAGIVGLLKSGADEDMLIRHLQAIEVEMMGLEATDDARRGARALLGLGIH